MAPSSHFAIWGVSSHSLRNCPCKHVSERIEAVGQDSRGFLQLPPLPPQHTQIYLGLLSYLSLPANVKTALWCLSLCLDFIPSTFSRDLKRSSITFLTSIINLYPDSFSLENKDHIPAVLKGDFYEKNLKLWINMYCEGTL